MPHERTRSLGWGWELLCEIELDNEVPAPIRERARAIGLLYPSPMQLATAIESRTALPATWTRAFLDARSLFREIQFGCTKSDATRASLRSTLRHFPDESLIELLADVQGDFAGWLAPDRRAS